MKISGEYLNKRNLTEKLTTFSMNSFFNLSRNFPVIFFITISFMTFLLSENSLRAEDTVESVCGDTLNPAPSASPEPMKVNYCKAAKTTQEAADTQSILWKVWAGVAGVCATECALSMTGTYTEELLCIVPTALAAAYDGYKSDNFMQSLMGLAPQVMNGGVLVDRAKNAMSDEKNQTKIDPKRKDFSSCMSAATSGFQAYSKHGNMKEQEEATKKSLEQAKSLKSAAAAPTVSNYSNPTGEFGHGAVQMGSVSQGGAEGTGAGATYAQADAQVSNTGVCSDKKPGAGAALSSAFVSCVVASDKNLPPWVGSQKFQKALEKSTGKPISDYLNKDGLTPTEVLASTMGGLGSSGTKLAAAMVADAEGYYGRGALEGAMYAGGHGGGAPASSVAAKEENPFASLQGFLGLNGAGSAKGPGNGVKEVVFAMQALAKDGKRSPASLAEDSRLGLFARVTVRYQLVNKRLEGGVR